MKWTEVGRVCNSCGAFKPWGSFSDKKAKRYRNREDAKIHQVKQPTCKGCAAQSTKEWNEKNKATAKHRYLLRQYGMTEEEYNFRIISQDNKCILCDKEFNHDTWCGDSPVVDHCHTHGHVRGVLCNECNRGLGYFRDSPKALLKAAEYLTGNI